MVGADGDDSSGTNSGSAYVFQDTSGAGDWSSFTETKLTASDAAERAAFGYPVAIYGGTIVVGAPGDDSNTGAVYVSALSEKPLMNTNERY